MKIDHCTENSYAETHLLIVGNIVTMNRKANFCFRKP